MVYVPVVVVVWLLCVLFCSELYKARKSTSISLQEQMQNSMQATPRHENHLAFLSFIFLPLKLILLPHADPYRGSLHHAGIDRREHICRSDFKFKTWQIIRRIPHRKCEHHQIIAVSRVEAAARVRSNNVLKHNAVVQFRRSEEHTSELQSPDHLVCRLLL